MTMRVRPAVAGVAALATFALASPAQGQSAADVVERMVEAYEDRVRVVENYSVLQEFMGFRSELYFEKEARNGLSVFELRATTAADGTEVVDPDDVGFTDLYASAPELAEHARYGGVEALGSEQVHVLLLDDVAALDMEVASAADEVGFVPRTGRILVDTNRLVPRQLEFVGDVETPNGPAEVTSRIDLEDYRDVDGMLLPFRTVIQVEGIGATIDQETRRQLEEMRAQLESMPESQRAMVEQMMGQQLEQMDAMLADDTMTVEMTVVSVRVNQGPPA